MAQFRAFRNIINENSGISDGLWCIASLVKISNNFDYIWESYGQETTQKQPKMIVSVVRKHFEIEKSETTSTISMRLSLYMYHLNTCHLPKFNGVNQKAAWGAFKKTPKNAINLIKSQL